MIEVVSGNNVAGDGENHEKIVPIVVSEKEGEQSREDRGRAQEMGLDDERLLRIEFAFSQG